MAIRTEAASRIAAFVIALFSILFWLACCGCLKASEQWEEAITYRQDAPGRGVDGQAMQFAIYMASKIKGGKIMVWRLTGRLPVGTEFTIEHAAVYWEVGDEVWLMDNFSKPVWVGYKWTTHEQMVLQFNIVAYGATGLRVFAVGEKL